MGRVIHVYGPKHTYAISISVSEKERWVLYDQWVLSITIVRDPGVPDDMYAEKKPIVVRESYKTRDDLVGDLPRAIIVAIGEAQQYSLDTDNAISGEMASVAVLRALATGDGSMPSNDTARPKHLELLKKHVGNVFKVRQV